ncbi:MAG: dihydrolipoyl dehydrogenase [Chloroflexi bacterium]|nr:dihydrolipoyl dehydrogenase [Chloroflexota bacterium]
MPETSFDLVVIGAGPGGYHAAIRGAQLGFKTAVVEKDDGTGIGGIGGVCLNWGCIPSKALLKNAELVNSLRHAADWGIVFEKPPRFDMAKAVERSRTVSGTLTQGIGYLFRKNKIEVFKGKGVLAGPSSVHVEGSGNLEAKHIVIATGARPRSLPGLEIDGKSIITSREALELKETPKSVGIVGGSAIGVEFAYYFRAYGTEVTIFEMLAHLVPSEDEEISTELERAFKKQGINFVTGAKVSGTERKGPQIVVKYEAAGKAGEFTCDKVLLGVGVQPNSDGIGLEKIGVQTERGFIKVNNKLQTTIPNVFAVGDVTGKMALAHVAFSQGVFVAEHLKGMNPPELKYPDMPRCTYCVPQVASVGLTEKQAREQGIKVKTGKFPFRGAGKAIAIGDFDGFVKLVTDEESGEILGAHMIGPDVTELLAELGAIKSLEGTPIELGATTHAHPTLSEAVKEAALAVHGEAIHI